MVDTAMAIVLAVLQQLPSGIQEFVRSLGPTEAAAYGGGGAGAFMVVRWLLKRRSASSASPTPTAVATTGGGSGGVANDKTAFTLPSLLPVSKGIRKVTHNEIHALELGAVVGFVVAWLYTSGRTDPAYTILIAFVAGSLGFKRYSSKAVKTIRMEPWYALLALAGGAGAGWAFFTGQVSLGGLSLALA